jgi:uroporphyrinogen-III decarboxylase
MTSKERFLASLLGKPVDRVAVMPKIWVDFSARLLDIDLKDVIGDPLTALRVIPLAAKKLGFDAARQFIFPAKKIEEQDGVVYELGPQGTRIGKIDMSGGLSTYLFDSKDYNIEDPRTIAYSHSWSSHEPLIETIERAEAIAVPDKRLFDQLGWAALQQKVIDEFGESISLVGDCGSATMSFYIHFRGLDNALLDLIMNPKLVHAVMEKGAQIAIEKGKYWLDNGLRVLRLNDSTGNMSLISPQHWDQFVYPYIERVCRQLHEYNEDAVIYCHICGNVLPVVARLREAGLDCIGPLDPLGGFTVAQARRAAGTDVSLMGGVDTLSLLNNTPDRIKEEAARCIDQAGEGGYVLSSGCVVPRACPPENLIALVEAAKEKAKN